MIQQYIEFYYPGSFVSETEKRPVADRTRPVTIPMGAYAYRFFERQEVPSDGETLCGAPRNHSAMTYFGKALTAEQVKALPGDYRVLLSNMECNGWSMVVQTLRGNFQPLNPGDIVLPPL